MFKVHYSSEQLSQRRAGFSTNQPTPIRKSFGLYHKNAPVRHWGPADLLHNPPGAQDPAHPLHGWYNQFDADESGSNHVHHPPFGYDFETGQLSEHVDKGRAQGRPETAHPLDAMIGHLGNQYGDMFKSMNMRLAGKNPKQLGMLVAENIFSNAIRKHNKKYGTNLPDINSAEWRRNHIGPHDKVSQAHERQVRGATPLEDGTLPLLNYSLNQGNVDMEHSDKGAWIDAGLHHMWEESRGQAELFNATIERDGLFGSPPVDPSIIPDIRKLSYMNSIKVPLEIMTFQKIRTMNRRKGQEFVEGSGHLPHEMVDGSVQSGVIENFHPLDALPWLPQGMFAYNTTPGGGTNKPANLARELKAKGIRPVGKPTEKFPDGQPYNLDNLAHTIYMNGLMSIGRVSNGPFHRAMQSLGAHHGVDTESDEYKKLLNQVSTRGKTTKGRLTHARHLMAIPLMMAFNKVREGVPKDEANEQAFAELRESDWQYGGGRGTHKHIITPEHEEEVRHLADALRQTEGHAGEEHRETGEMFVEPHRNHPDHAKHSLPSEGWGGLIHTKGARISETADAAHAAADAQLQQAMNRPDQSIQQDSYEQGLKEAQDNLFATSNDRHVSDLLKTMERVQMHDAVNDTFVKSITPSQSYSLSNSTHVGVIAKQLSLANMDIHGIYHSQGDWERVAKDWSVDLSTVKVIKATFGSVDA